MLKTALFFAILFILFSACKQEPLEPPAPGEPEPKPISCKCSKIISGYYEMEDCQVYINSLPATMPFSCVGGKLEIAISFEQNRVTFRSPVWKFCPGPVKLYTCAGPCAPLSGYACEAHVFSTDIDPLTGELCLEIDDEFLPCSAEEDDGFWFALAVQ